MVSPGMLGQKVDKHRHFCELPRISSVLVSFEPLASQIVLDSSILAALGCERDSKIHIHRNRAGQQTGSCLHQVFHGQPANENHIVVVAV
jgi:hypothetical protein